MLIKRHCLILAVMFITGCAPGSLINIGGDGHEIMLETVGDSRARQLYIEGFETLSPRERILAYYLTQAGLAGRDIYYDQNHKHALEIRDLCEELLLHCKDIDPDIYNAIREYAHRVWINGSQYYHHSKSKFVPAFTPDELERAIAFARGHGADIRWNNDTSAILLERSIFDSTYQPMITVKDEQASVDIIAASANNFYEGVTAAEVDEWAMHGMEKYPQNSRIIKSDSGIMEQVYRTGLPDSNIAQGMYAEELGRVTHFLEKAIPYADTVQAKSIRSLIRFYRTGDMKHMNQMAIHWIRHNPRLDFLQGFIEVYTDPRGKKGSFQNIVYFEDVKKTGVMKQLVDLAPYFESKAPFADKFKRTDFGIKPSAIAALIVSGSGDGGPIPPAGLNLPNDHRFREKHGSKNLIFTNVMGISGGNTYTGRRDYVRKFIYDFFHPRDIEALKKGYEDASFAMVCLHELIGHGSGRIDPDMPGNPTDSLREYYSTIEEARAELMALWNIHDPALRRIGLINDHSAADEVYRHWARYYLIKLSQMEDQETIEQDHERARHLIVNYIIEQGGIRINKIKGKLFARVTSIDAFREAVGKLLAEITRIKGEGDYEAARDLVLGYGVLFNMSWRDEMVARYKELRGKQPVITSFGFSMPLLAPVKNRNGDIIDVEVEYLRDFEREQLIYSGKITPP
ncbi:MAG: hypothetical protein V2J62_04170 [candidate division KSB1 bacterium]|jgi:dipeptidyl-peptidase-3|nr:hypothetical protein [candidate division KSB1 bacterium]